MHVADLMITDVQTIEPDAPLTDALAVLSEGHLSALPVVDAHEHLVGVLSTTDVLQAMAEAEGRADRERLFSRSTVGDLMTSHPVAVSPGTTVREAAQQMLYLEVHRLFVVEDERLVGIISQSDIVRGVALARL